MGEYKSKGKQPYIPLYIGDWEQDVNSISLEAEGALLKLILKLWKSPTKGEIEISFNQLSILLKKGQEMAVNILQELHENQVLDIEFLPNSKAKIKNRRMLKDSLKALSAKENGSKGGRPKKPNDNPTESKPKAKAKLITENEYENEYNSLGSNNNLNKRESFFSDLPNSSYLENICRDLNQTKEQVLNRLQDFRAVAEQEYATMAEFSTHLKRWINKNPVKKSGGMVW